MRIERERNTLKGFAGFGIDPEVDRQDDEDVPGVQYGTCERRYLSVMFT